MTESDRRTAAEAPPQEEKLRQEAQQNIRRYRKQSSRGLWALALFILLCLVAVGDFAIFPSLPPDIKKALGRPPTPLMISGALVLYTFSAIILILSRMMSGSGDYSGFSHVGYLLGFFVFYHFAGALADNFLAVVAAGLTVLSLESYHIWSHCQERVREEQETVDRLDRMLQWRTEGKNGRSAEEKDC